MKNLKKLSLGLVALIGFGLLVTLNAFTAFTGKDPEYVRYQYNNNTPMGIDDPLNWTDVTNTSPNSCGDAGTLSCVIEFDSNLNPDIADFLSNYDNLTAIKAHSTEIESKEDLTP